MSIATLFENNFLTQSAFEPLQIFLSLLATLTMSLIIDWIYKKTFSGVLYSKNFSLTLITTALVVNTIMIGISGNIVLSLGLVGALSIVRFRTAVKDPKDTAFIFWAITLGVINGVAYYELSVISTIIIGIVLMYISRQQIIKNTYLLIIKYPLSEYENVKNILNNTLKNSFYVKSDTRKHEMVENIIEINANEDERTGLMSELGTIKNIEKCTIVTSNSSVAE